jgi:serine/threonine protein kinase
MRGRFRGRAENDEGKQLGIMNTEKVNNLCMGCFTERNSPAGACPHCGYNEAAEMALHLLRPRTILNGKYLVGRVLGEGGFGITYIGWDLNLDMKVALKEYYPAGFVTREITATTTVNPFTGSDGDFFRKGREKFIGEARALAKFFDLPGVVLVKDFFQENGTAYIVMTYIEGQTLKSHLDEMGGKLPAAQVFDMMKQIVESLAQIHDGGLIHRDISPDNIMISKTGMKLLDFGAAREYGNSGSKSLSIMLKPGYAPEEQYRSKGVQGPWTDVYALCATMYRCITGIAPDEPMQRILKDEVVLPSALGVSISRTQEAALMKGIAVLQEDRFKSMRELYAALYDETQKPPLTEPQPRTADNHIFTMPALEKPNWFVVHKRLLTICAIAALLVVADIKLNLREAVGSYLSSVLADIEREAAADSSPVPAAEAASFEVGEVVTFGSYEWRVLEVHDDKALLLSEYVIEQGRYNLEKTDVTWETCTLREYLNDEFYSSFSSDDKMQIVQTRINNNANQWYGISGGNDTDDYIFLLSLEETVKYFGDSGQLQTRVNASPAYMINDEYNDARIAYDLNGAVSWWWLRTPGGFSSRAVSVTKDGWLNINGNNADYIYGIRPALWLSLQQDIDSNVFFS